MRACSDPPVRHQIIKKKKVPVLVWGNMAGGWEKKKEKEVRRMRRGSRRAFVCVAVGRRALS